MSTTRAGSLASRLESRIRSRRAVVGVIGLGYVGLPLVRLFATKGFPVLGFDIDTAKVEKLCRGESYIRSVSAETLRRIHRRFEATADFARLSEADAIIICVPTPLQEDGRPDLSFIRSTADTIARHLRPGQLVVLESTTYPGTTREILKPPLDRRGVEYYLAFSPEREDPGNKDWTNADIPKVVGGIDERSRRLAARLYGAAVRRVVEVSSCEVAEAAKLLENIYRCVNIALVNELKMCFERMGIDVWEVIAAASTKPFGFQPFYPGPGLGGHCADGDEFVFVAREGGLDPVRLRELARGRDRKKIGDVEVFPLDGIEVLSFDLRRGKTCLRPATHVFRRWYPRRLTLRSREGRTLTATDGHPMIVLNGRGLETRRADTLDFDSSLVVALDLPRGKTPRFIDLLRALRLEKAADVRVVPRAGRWIDHWSDIRREARRSGVEKKDVRRHNTLPLRVFLDLERRGWKGFRRADLLLATGRGLSHTRMPLILPVDADFARLIGYYVTEGCLTRDASWRTRWTFGAHEPELIADVRNILTRFGIRHSVHRVRRWKAVQIKVSSNLFGRLLDEALGCGRRSEEMRLPPFLLGGDEELRRAVLGALLSGDGSVNVSTGRRPYRKRGKDYVHAAASAYVSYFSSSPKLLQQATLLLHSLRFVPTVKRGKPELRLYGKEQALRLLPLLRGSKKEKLERYLREHRRPRAARHIRIHGGFAAVPPDEIRRRGGGWVYSIEVPGTQTFVTSYGLVSHNCIPIDPFYLSWKAKEFQFATRFIDLAGEINVQMPYYVVGKLEEALRARGRTLPGSRILVLGLAYKRDIDDPRESPSFKIIELLEQKGADVSCHDPFFPAIPPMRHYRHLKAKAVPLRRETLASSDAVVIVTDHSAYDYPWIVRHAKLVLDTRNACRGVRSGREKIVKA
jgi:UDP-N-acetyl-D-mannosaminuronate dehydrogenase/intein/homing endonuclease